MRVWCRSWVGSAFHSKVGHTSGPVVGGSGWQSYLDVTLLGDIVCMHARVASEVVHRGQRRFSFGGAGKK